METDHRVYVGDARAMAAIDDDDVELVVTSPPYPMIEMWDDLFASLDPAIERALETERGQQAFDLMHDVLDGVWAEVKRVLVDGGIACINVGDATRTIGESFRVYPNHARVIDAFEQLGFEPLPDILWHKPTNSAAKFMGSGMIPPNAYATLEHEYLLVFRNGPSRRTFTPGADRRYNAAYFWEERNDWFSDIWTDVTGTIQQLETDDSDLRERSAAYPLAIPYRLINMYSVYDDTVLDPFWGTGTTTLAAMSAGRNSVGYELDGEFLTRFGTRVGDVTSLADSVISRRLARHRAFVADRLDEGHEFQYDAIHYDVPVMTKQERRLRFYTVESVTDLEMTESANGFLVSHSPYET